MAQAAHASELGPKRLFTVDEVMSMVDAGILSEDDKVELIEGELWRMTPQGPPHSSRIDEIHERLAEVYRGLGYVRDQKPLVASHLSLPEPDLAVVRGSPRTYSTKHPVGEDAILVVEIAVSSERRDRQKTRVYAAAGVAVYWLIDLASHRLTVFDRPDAARGEYLSTKTLDANDEVVLPESSVSWPVAGLVD
jgi:Uma2 family endonuclease